MKAELRLLLAFAVAVVFPFVCLGQGRNSVSSLKDRKVNSEENSGPLSDARDVRFGGCFSPKACGLTLALEGGGNSFGNLSLLADLDEVPEGNSKDPGVALFYTRNFVLRQWEGEYSTGRFYLGPGACVGNVSDNGSRGWMAGLCVAMGLNFSFHGSPLELGIGLSAVIGLLAEVEDRYDSRVSFYSNGIERAWMPELSLRWRL